MADDYFDAKLAYNPATGGVVPLAQADVYAITDTAFVNELALTDLQGIPIAKLTAGPTGVYPPFKVAGEPTKVFAVSGSMVTPMSSVNGLKGEKGDTGTSGTVDYATSSNGQVLTSNGPSAAPSWKTSASGISGAPSVWPSTFPSSPHTHTATQISDSTAVGRGLVTAPDAQSARAAIGAGTGNGTSNLAIGTTGTTAAAGNHVHGASSVTFSPSGSITATDVQAAIVQAASQGGGGGTGASEVRIVKYASGQYPALPGTKPTGVNLFMFKGPVQPTSGNVSGGLPSYLGDGSTQIMADYEYRNLS